VDVEAAVSAGAVGVIALAVWMSKRGTLGEEKAARVASVAR